MKSPNLTMMILLLILSSCNDNFTIKTANKITNPSQCTGPYSSNLSSNAQEAYDQTIERLKIIRLRSPENRGCVNLIGADLMEVFTNADARHRIVKQSGYLTEADMANFYCGGTILDDCGYSSIVEFQMSEDVYSDPLILQNLDLTNVTLNEANLSGYCFQNLDFSKEKNKGLGILGLDVNASVGFCGVIYPQIDVSSWDLTGKSINGADLTKVTGLTVSMLNSATTFTYSKLPAMDVTGWNTTGKNFTGVDLTKVTGLTVSMLNSATVITFAKLPAMDVTGWNTTGKMLYEMDFTKVTGLTVAMLNSANLFGASSLPAMDVTGLNTTGKSLGRIDFSRVTGLTCSMINNSSTYIDGAILPAINISDCDFSNKIYAYSDFKLTTGNPELNLTE